MNLTIKSIQKLCRPINMKRIIIISKTNIQQNIVDAHPSHNRERKYSKNIALIVIFVLIRVTLTILKTTIHLHGSHSTMFKLNLLICKCMYSQ